MHCIEFARKEEEEENTKNKQSNAWWKVPKERALKWYYTLLSILPWTEKTQAWRKMNIFTCIEMKNWIICTYSQISWSKGKKKVSHWFYRLFLLIVLFFIDINFKWDCVGKVYFVECNLSMLVSLNIDLKWSDFGISLIHFQFTLRFSYDVN